MWYVTSFFLLLFLSFFFEIGDFFFFFNMVFTELKKHVSTRDFWDIVT